MFPTNSGQDISDRLHDLPSMDNCFPVALCPNCMRANTPFGITILTGDELTVLYYCLNCGFPIQKYLQDIVGWVSIIDLEEKWWDDEL